MTSNLLLIISSNYYHIRITRIILYFIFKRKLEDTDHNKGYVKPEGREGKKVNKRSLENKS